MPLLRDYLARHGISISEIGEEFPEVLAEKVIRVGRSYHDKTLRLYRAYIIDENKADIVNGEWYIVTNKHVINVFDGDIEEVQTIEQFVMRWAGGGPVPDLQIATCGHGYMLPAPDKNWEEWQCPTCAVEYYCQQECPTSTKCLDCPIKSNAQIVKK